MSIVGFGYAVIALIFCIFSFGFIDPNLHLSTHPVYLALARPIMFFVYKQSYQAAFLYIGIVVGLFALYWKALEVARAKQMIYLGLGFIVAGVLLFLSYPALSYDIYNYILTAKVAFYYHENPYVVMPIEFIGEPMLAYTRAANKLALYGPVWIASTYIPYIISGNYIPLAIYAFKMLAIVGYIGIIYIIARKTRRLEQVVFFALNPLVIIETFTSGHNDAFMMFLALFGVILMQKKAIVSYASGLVLLFSSIFVKGATVVIVPVMLFLRRYSVDVQIRWIAALLFGIFLLSPIREEMYPWYAIWWLAILAFVPIQKNSWVHTASFWLSLSLMLRYVPWMATREYGGYVPLIRFLITIIPVCIYMLVFVFLRFRKKK